MTMTLGSLPPLTRLRTPIAPPAPAATTQWVWTELLAQTPWTSTHRAHPAGVASANQFAIKHVRSGLVSDYQRELACGLLQREAEVSFDVDHAHLAATLKVERQGDDVWLLQPFAAALPLLTATTDQCLPGRLWLARQIATALAALHTAGWLHGNVTPEAITITGQHATLGDLGWSRRSGSEECDLANSSFAGCVRYAAPELFDSIGRLTPAADVYSLGAVVLEMFSGKTHLNEYEGAELIAVKRLVGSTIPAHAQLPFGVSSLLCAMLNRDPLRRPTSQEVVSALLAQEIEAFGLYAG